MRSNLRKQSCLYGTPLKGSCEATPEKTPSITTAKLSPKPGPRWNGLAPSSWRQTLTTNKYSGSYSTPTSGQELRLCSETELSSRTHSGFGGGTATQLTIRIRHTHQTSTCQHNLPSHQPFRAANSPTTSLQQSRAHQIA